METPVGAGDEIEGVEVALINGQFDVYFDPIGGPVGFVNWAFASKTVTQTISEFGLQILTSAEWQVGNDFWIANFSTGGHVAIIAINP